MTISDIPRSAVRAAMLDVEFYNDVERDAGETLPAAIVVIVATGISGIGSAIATDANVLLALLGGSLTGVLGWVVWSTIALFVGRNILGGTSDLGEMLRVIGFSYVPLVIGIIPWLGFVGALWALLAAVIAIREGMDFSTPKALVTTAVGWAAWLLLAVGVHTVIDIQIGGGWPF